MKQPLNIDKVVAKKSLGQNFIKDNNFLSIMSSKIITDKNTNIIEIGPGTGALTNFLVGKEFKSIYLIEKDRVLANKLKAKYSHIKNVYVMNDDALKMKYDRFFKIKNNIIIGNLPFNISTQLLFKWLEINNWPPFYNSMTLMFQKEVANRITANPSCKEYSRITVSAQSRCKIKKILHAPSSIFFPRPKVDGVVLRFTPHLKYKNINFNILQSVLRLSFSQRRKKIKTSLKIYINEIKKSKIDENLRPDDLTIDDYIKIVNLLDKTNFI